MDVFMLGVQYLISEPTTILLLIFGVFFGIVFGCIPGLTATLGVILLIPFTFTMAPAQGLSLLIGIYVGGISGGLITATLINIPGTPSSIVTCWDGYPMAKKGEPGKALSVGVFASLIGGIFSALALIFIAPLLAKVALIFGSWEYFALAALGLSIVVSMTSNDTIKGLIGAVLGLLLGTVGIDNVTGIVRLSFNMWQLQAGISVTALMMGLFAFREIFEQTTSLGQSKKKLSVKGLSFLPPLKSLKGTGPAFVLGPIIGVSLGILPGIGQNTASILTYNQTRQLSKTPERFGTGCVEGIVASETSNNAVNGGALIPLVTLGIPGDMVTAALIGGLMIHGLQPGPMLFVQSRDIIGAIMIAYLLANIIMYILELGLMKIFVRMVDVPLSYLFPTIILTSILGVFAINNRIFDLWILVIFGIVGYFLSEFGVEMPPVILGFILGPLVEKSFRTALIGSQGNMGDVLGRPIAMIFLIFSGIFILWPIIKAILLKINRKTADQSS